METGTAAFARQARHYFRIPMAPAVLGVKKAAAATAGATIVQRRDHRRLLLGCHTEMTEPEQ